MKFDKKLFLKTFEKHNYNFSDECYACLDYNNISNIIDYVIYETCIEIQNNFNLDFDYYEEFNDEINELRSDFQDDAIEKVDISYKKLDVDFINAFEEAKKQSDKNTTIFSIFVKTIEKDENKIVNVWHVEQNDLKSEIERDSIKSLCYNYYLNNYLN